MTVHILQNPQYNKLDDIIILCKIDWIGFINIVAANTSNQCSILRSGSNRFDNSRLTMSEGSLTELFVENDVDYRRH